MKRSKKYVKKLKSRIQVSTLCIATILMLIAIGKLAGLSVPIDNIKDVAKERLTADESITQEEEEKTSKVTIAEDGAIVCDSIVQGVIDSELENGTYTFRVIGNINGTNETKNYKVELINYYDDVTYSLTSGQTSRTISLGDSTTEYKMLVVKYHGNLTVDKGVTLTATTVNNLTYKKGMYICALGNIYNNGNISMTARGTYNQAGENVYLWKNNDSTYEYVPALGGVGGAAQYTSARGGILNGRSGTSGTGRQTGGGGTGGRKKLDESYNNKRRRKRNIIFRR